MDKLLLMLWGIAGIIIFLNRKSNDVEFWKLEFLFTYLALLVNCIGKVA